MSWDQLLQIRREARLLAEEERRRPPVACSFDGTPLEDGPRGELHCRFCGALFSR
jgi:hypothetical protein